MNRISMIHRAVAFAYYAALLWLLLAGGGLFYLTVRETPAPFADDETGFAVAVGLVVVAALLVAASGATLMRRDRQRFAFGTLTLLLLTPATLYFCELVARFFVPGWPANGLHGVPPQVAAASWGKGDSLAGGGGYNAWGQRDRSRTVQPAAGVYRIAFIGDSFLEESAAFPVSLRVEQKLGRSDVEVLNLGVSATGPDEYFYRTQHVALALGARHSVLFLYAGNDFVAPVRSLESILGIAAVSPRGSFFSTVRLSALNHLLLNRRRPVLQAWFPAGDLRAREQQLESALAGADDDAARSLLLRLAAPDMQPWQRAVLAERLDRPEMASFFAMLRKPDKGLFRSHYLWPALGAASVGQGQWDHMPESEEPAYSWVRRTQATCSAAGTAFTLVIIPEAFQVDPRMCAQWSPLADMRHYTESCRRAAERLRDRARGDGMSVIDLHDMLQDVPGTYLNLDGHWSDQGVELVSDVLSRLLKETVK